MPKSLWEGLKEWELAHSLVPVCNSAETAMKVFERGWQVEREMCILYGELFYIMMYRLMYGEEEGE